MANKKKNTSRQRRKQAARAQGVQPSESPEVTPAASSSADVASKPSRFGLGRWRKNSASTLPEKEPWTRWQITVLILLAVVIQTVISPFVVRGASVLDSALVFVGPQMLLGVVLAQPIARRLVHARTLGVLETLTVGATISLVGYFAQYALVLPLITPSNTPAATATATPSPSPSQKTSSKASPTASNLAVATPAPSPLAATSAKPSPAATPNLIAAVTAKRPCPLDQPNCTYSVPAYEIETAQGMSDAVGVIASIFLYAKIHRLFWMPKLRAKEREARNKKRALKSK